MALALLTCLLSASLEVPLLRAQEATVPVRMQVQLFSRCASYDRTLQARKHNGQIVVLVVAGKDASSSRVAAQLRAGLGELANLGGAPIRVVETTFSAPAALAASTKNEHAAIVYLASGLSGQAAAIGTALASTKALTVSAVAADVPVGITLGFDLENSRPKILVNTARAASSGITFSGQLLQLARRYP